MMRFLYEIQDKEIINEKVVMHLNDNSLDENAVQWAINEIHIYEVKDDLWVVHSFWLWIICTDFILWTQKIIGYRFNA